MWKPCAKAVRLYYRGLPLVYDSFHILADYSRTLNEIRVDEANKLEGTPEGGVIKGTRYLLLVFWLQLGALGKGQQPTELI